MVSSENFCLTNRASSPARAARSAGLPFCLSTVSLCSLSEVTAAAGSEHLWFQLYVIRDRPFMRDLLETALALGVRTLSGSRLITETSAPP